MHDRFGQELQLGDVVLVPAVVKGLYPTEGFCNVQLESLFGRRPDGNKETIYAINTGVLVKSTKVGIDVVEAANGDH